MLFSESQRKLLQSLSEAKEDAIDEGWIKGIRNGWKKLVDQTKNFSDRTDKHERDLAFARKMAENAGAALQNVENYLYRLRSDLLITKGFWTLPSEAGSKELNLAKRWKTKVVEELDAASEAIDQGRRNLKHWVEAYITEPDDNSPWLGAYHREIATPEGFNTILRTINGSLDEAIDKADAAISGRLLRHLSALVKQSPVGPSGKAEPVEMGGAEPDVVHIGGLTIIFADTPDVSPSRIGSETETEVGHKAKTQVYLKKIKLGFKKQDTGEALFRRPTYRKSYIQHIKDAVARMEAKRLGFLMKGVEVVVKAAAAAPTNQYGAHLGVGGNYNRHTDTIGVFSDPGPFIVELLIHELGHRYYYKFMSQMDRENFGRWFGQVPAVSEYGGKHRREDFAEVFLHYVMSRELTKGQRERFEQFMKGKRPRLEDKAMEQPIAGPVPANRCNYCDAPAVKKILWDSGKRTPSATQVCRAHEGDARDEIAKAEGSVLDVMKIDQSMVSYREGFNPNLRMDSALEQAPAFAYCNDEIGTHFGLRVDRRARESALDEAPVPKAPIGRADSPRGAVLPVRTGGDVMGMTGEPIKRATGKGLGRGTSGPERTITMPDRTRREIPDSFFQMLGSDWKSMKATRVHDNRITISVDGVRYSLYTRRG